MTKQFLRRAIFLDRDGVINANRPDHVKNWDEFVFLPGALSALRRLASSEFLVVVTTNQSVINRKIAEEAVVCDIHYRMVRAIDLAGGCISAVYYCPHTPAENCECRKPKPGMLLRAARELEIDLPQSYLVGDASIDVQAAQAVGALPILVESGRGCDYRQKDGDHCTDCRINCHVARDLAVAVEWILSREQWKQPSG